MTIALLLWDDGVTYDGMGSAAVFVSLKSMRLLVWQGKDKWQQVQQKDEQRKGCLHTLAELTHNHWPLRLKATP